jgi:SAM-dependent methyltransferase
VLIHRRTAEIRAHRPRLLRARKGSLVPLVRNLYWRSGGNRERIPAGAPRADAMSFTVDAVIDDLGYRQAGDLLERDVGHQTVEPARRQAWREATERLNINAAFFQGGVPLVYFRGLRVPSDADVEDAIDQLHRQGWNHGRAPFLVVVLPDEVRVLDNRTTPFDDFTVLRATTIDALADFSYGSLMSGRLTPRLEGRRRFTVVDQLRADLRSARLKLVSLGLNPEAANDLLGRSLFVQYLDDRHVLSRVVASANASLEETTQTSVDAVYELFAAVYARFNGDVFPVSDDECTSVGLEHLEIVLDFLRGVRGGQLPMISYYDFSVIPAELLSNIYEEFLEDEQRGSAAHYTPEYIVDLALEEVLPVRPSAAPTRVLDPACGSGIFLARAYRRLIDLDETRLGRPLEPSELAKLLARSIFGCDTMPSAVAVAALSCYLVLLDHCREDDIVERVRFPTLLGSNLFVGDFFELQDSLPGPYDVIASNPPWKRWTDAAAEYVAERSEAAGDKQLAHAFLWGGLARLASLGQMVILMPAKVLYNRSGPNIAFRRTLVEDTHLELVIDFSAFRHELFAKAKGPMALMVLRGQAQQRQPYITFCTPHPTPLSNSTGRVVLAGGDIKRLPRSEAARRPEYFKATLFGSLRDANLLERLQHRTPTLGEVERHGELLIGLGYQIGGSDHHQSSFLRQTPRVESKDIEPFRVLQLSPPPETTTFHRTPDDAIFRGAHILVGRAIDRFGFVQAAFLDHDASFNNTIVGITAPGRTSEELQALTALLNSALARYLLFLTATSWGVERPMLEGQDLRTLPLVIPEGSAARTLARITARASRHGATEQDRLAIDDTVAELHQLSATDRRQIGDLLRYGIDLHIRKARSAAFEPPTPGALKRYRRLLQRQLSAALRVEVDALVELNGHPWATVSIGLGTAPPDIADHYRELAALSQSAQETSGSVVLRRTMRVYHTQGVVMTKPAEARHWTESAALQDSDDVIAECLRAAAREEGEASLVGLSG